MHFSFLAAIFESRLWKMAATVMIAEFGTIQNDPSLEEYSEACLLRFFWTHTKLIENYVSCDILV